MGKLLGLLLGSLFMGPIGALFGLAAGFAFDSFKKFDGFSYQFTFGEDTTENLYEQAFPLLAAYISRNIGLNREAVLAVKTTMINLFGHDRAKELMKMYKKYAEGGVPESLLQSTCFSLKVHLTQSQRFNFFVIFIKMFGQMNTRTRENSKPFITLASLLDIPLHYFTAFNSSFNTHSGYHSRYSQREQYSGTVGSSPVNPYKVLELGSSASNDEIKKKYRTLSKKYHPDITQHLPQYEQEKAQQKMRDLNSAYEQLKKERHIK